MKIQLYKNEERQLKELKALLSDINRQLDKATLILCYFRADDKKIYYSIKQYIKGKREKDDYFISPRDYFNMRDTLKSFIFSVSDLRTNSSLLTFIEKKQLSKA